MEMSLSPQLLLSSSFLAHQNFDFRISEGLSLLTRASPDESFDLVITQDVMEHVFAPAEAFSEIALILNPGGAYILSVLWRGFMDAQVPPWR
jgi:2-polyprenyl-3-methyl-5-hydroxy-6-metoxy-1,4-benzoquinol methylase